MKQIKSYEFSLFGIKAKEYWTLKNNAWHFTAMNFFDALYQYGLIGAILVNGMFLKSLRRAWMNGLKHPLSIILFVVFAYSFFGVYVIFTATSRTIFSFLVGLHLHTKNRVSAVISLNPQTSF